MEDILRWITTKIEDDNEIYLEEAFKAYMRGRQRKREENDRKTSQRKLDSNNYLLSEILTEIQEVNQNLKELMKMLLYLGSGIKITENETNVELADLQNAQSLSLEFWDNEADDIWNDWTGEE